MDLFSHNGVIKPKSDATVSLFDIEYTYGFGVYESIRVVKDQIKYIEQHIERLMHSARVIELEHQFTSADIRKYIEQLVEKVDSDAFNLKLLLIGGRNAHDANFYALPLAPTFPNRKLYKQGAHAITIEYERYLPGAKTLNMLPSYLAYRDAKKQDAYDAILVNSSGEMLEGTRTNLFALKDSTLYTPPVEEVLEGVTRMNAIACAQENGFTIAEKPLRLKAISDYDSFFLTSTSSKIMPLRSINSTQLTISDRLKQLMKYFTEYQQR